MTKKKKHQKHEEAEENQNVFSLDDAGDEVSLQDMAEALAKEYEDSKDEKEPEKGKKDVEKTETVEKKTDKKESADSDALKHKVKKLEAEVASLVAENRNQKIRIENEFRSKIQYAMEGFFKDFIPIMDAFDKALTYAPECDKDDACYPFIEGIQHLHNNMVNLMKKFKLEAYESEGKPFDPNLHQAMRMVDAEGFEANTVVNEYFAGYKYGDRILRPAMVEIATGNASTEDKEADEETVESEAPAENNEKVEENNNKKEE